MSTFRISALALASGAFLSGSGSTSAQTVQPSHVQRFDSSRAIPQQMQGTPDLAGRLARQSRAAISVAAGNFFEDGKNGLITGYSLGTKGVIASQRGRTLPGSDDADGSPFAEAATAVEVDMRPDFMRSGNLFGGGHEDLVVAARGGSALQVLRGDGKGGFAVQPSIAVTGSIHALATWRSSGGTTMMAAGVCSATCSVEIYSAEGTHVRSIGVGGEPAAILSARVNGRSAEDLLVSGPRGVTIVDGNSIDGESPRVETLRVSDAVAAAAGSFVYDRRSITQIAVLTADGTIHTFARAGIVSTPPTPPTTSVRNLHPEQGRGGQAGSSFDVTTLAWTEVETLTGVAQPTGRVAPILLRARVSGSGMDDLVAMNVNGGQTTTVRHPMVLLAPEPGAISSGIGILPAQVETGENSGDVAAALAVRVSQDARSGLIVADNQAQPQKVKSTNVYHTYTVNTTSDSTMSAIAAAKTACTNNNSGCTLRAAFNLVDIDATANQGAGRVDVVNIFPGTYTLGNNGPDDGFGDARYHIEIYGPVNVIGAGASSTFIGAQNLDHVLSENSGNAPADSGAPGDANAQIAMDFYMTGVTLNNGTLPTTQGGDGGGGLMDADTGGQGNVTLVDNNFTGGINKVGRGGAVYVSDQQVNDVYGTPIPTKIAGNGVAEIDGGTFSGNKTSEDGGGFATFINVPIFINGVTFTNNQTTPTISSDTYGFGQGGAIYFGALTNLGCAASSCGPAPLAKSQIMNSTFTGNTSTTNSNLSPTPTAATTQTAGGAVYAHSGVDITNSVFTGNSNATVGNAIGGQGGAIYELAQLSSPTLSGLTITGNSARDGGGIFISNCNTGSGGNCPSPSGLPVTIQYNRITGNTASDSSGRSGLAIGPDSGTSDIPANTNAAVTATYNFWGCNGAATGMGCDTAAENAGGGTLTLTPYAMVSATLSSTTPTPGTTLTLTGGITTDSTNATLSNLNAFTGVAGGTTTSSGATEQNPGGAVSAVLTLSQNSSQLVTATSATSAAATASLGTTVSASGSGTGTVKIDNATATVNFSVTVASPTVALAFSPSSIAVNGTTTLTLTLANPNTNVSLTGVAVSLSLFSGETIAATPALSNGCGGTVTAAANSGSIAISGVTINAASNCVVSVNVTATTMGAKVNTTGNITATNETASGTTGSATLTVTAPPTISAAFAKSQALVGGADTLTFTIANTGTSTQSGVAFSGTLPNDLTISNPSGLTNTCGGTATASAGSGSYSLTGGSLSSGGSCAFSFSVTTSAIQGDTVTSGTVSSTSGGTGLTASTPVNVVAVPVLALATLPNPFNRGTQLVATYTVTAGSIPPATTFQFFDGATQLGTAAGVLTNTTTYTATYTTTSTLSAGTHALLAKYPGDTNYPAAATASQSVLVIANDVWIGDGNGNTSGLYVDGTALVPSAETSGGVAVAIDSSGNVWSVNKAANSVAKYTSAGAVTSAGYTGGGLSTPTAVAIDGVGQVWITNTTNSISVFNNNGTAFSPTAYTGGGLNAPSSLTIDSSGNLWIANHGGSSVTEVLGAAAPTVQPLSTAVSNNTTGTQP